MRPDRSRFPFLILLAALALLVITTSLPRPSATPVAADQNTVADQDAANASDPGVHDPDVDEPAYTTETLRGRVVWLADAMHRRFGVETDPDAIQHVVALETDGGQLHPLVKDDRGRGFLLDPRLRDVDMELLVRRFPGSPFVQTIQVYTLKPEGRFLIDYWCDICSIPMYELKECECCQGPIRIRERPADPP